MFALENLNRSSIEGSFKPRSERFPFKSVRLITIVLSVRQWLARRRCVMRGWQWRWQGGGRFKADWLAWQKLPKSEARYVQHANTRLEIIFVINCTS